MVPTRTSSQFPLPHSEPPASPPLSQPQHFNTDEPMYGHLKSKAPSSSSLERPPQSRRFDTIEPASKAPPPSRSEGAWECREGENILVEDQIERCLSRNSSSQDADNMGQCDFRIFELRKDGYSLPTRRIAIRSCESGERCISFCEAPLIIDVLRKCLLHWSRDATGQRTCRNRTFPSRNILVRLFKHT